MNLFANFFLIIALLMVIVAFFSRKQAFDIHLGDTYYIVSRPTYFFILSGALIVLAGLYLLAAPMLNSFLSWIHVAFTAATIISIIVISFLRPDRPIKFANVGAMRTYATYNSLFVITMFLLVFAQLAFVLNLILGAIKAFMK